MFSLSHVVGLSDLASDRFFEPPSQLAQFQSCTPEPKQAMIPALSFKRSDKALGRKSRILNRIRFSFAF